MKLPVATWLRAFAVVAGVCLGAESRAGEDPVAQFEQEVRPIFEKRCFECHGPDKQKGGLRLDLKSSALEGGESGEPAVVPGKSAESQLIKFVTSKDPDDAMPPKGERLGAEQVAALKHWIDMGAHWPSSKPTAETVTTEAPEGMAITDREREFWSFQPPHRSEPALTGDASWVRQPLDRFILAKLRARGLEPSREASKAVFIRRVTFDLTGLPPTPEELDDFLADTSPEAAEQLVVRLLGSPRFGERMASLWLPLARFAEDQALQVGDDSKLFYPNAYHYRAWVIEAFNRDLPYDRFLEFNSPPTASRPRLPTTRGARLSRPRPEILQSRPPRRMADEWEDRVDTVTRTMLGLTVACARCHDHKFDPISTRDYYALAGVFASTRMVNKTADGRVEKEAQADKIGPEILHIVEDGDVRGSQCLRPRQCGTQRPGGRTPLPGSARARAGRSPSPKAAAGASSPRPSPAPTIRSPRASSSIASGAPFSDARSSPRRAISATAGRCQRIRSCSTIWRCASWIAAGRSKALVREIALSATYRQAAASDPAKASRRSGQRARSGA